MIQAHTAVITNAPIEQKKSAIRSLYDLLHALVGRVVTLSHPESMKGIPLGHQIKPSFHRSKILNVYDDLVIVAAEDDKEYQKVEDAPVKQFIPFSSIKLVCLMNDDIHIHI